MRVLALDTSGPACSVALWENGLVGARRETMDRGHSEALIPMIRDLMSAHAWTMDDLGLIAVTTGPGAFTGLRIGLAATKGLALATGTPCIGVTTFQVLAQGIPETERGDTPFLLAIASKRPDLYVQLFDGDLSPQSQACCVLSGDLADVVVEAPKLRIVGDARDEAADALRANGHHVLTSEAANHPDAPRVAEAALAQWKPGETPAPVMPLYIRPPDAVVPVNGGKLR